MEQVGKEYRLSIGRRFQSYKALESVIVDRAESRPLTLYFPPYTYLPQVLARASRSLVSNT